jgi:hypothetical protein
METFFISLGILLSSIYWLFLYFRLCEDVHKIKEHLFDNEK